MCRWSCSDINSTFMCKWCGTRYCRECLRGEFPGLMRDATICAKCNQKKCQGQKVENASKEYLKDDDDKGKKGSRSASRGRSASSKRGKSASGKNKSGKKSGKKKKRK